MRDGLVLRWDGNLSTPHLTSTINAAKSAFLPHDERLSDSAIEGELVTTVTTTVDGSGRAISQT